MRIVGSARLQYKVVLRLTHSIMSASRNKPNRPPAPIRQAASVIVLRPSAGDSFQILLVERMARDGSQYLNAHVFPGGQVETLDEGNIRRTALRELYEEASLHLQSSPSSTFPHGVIPQAVQFNTSHMPFSQFLKISQASTAEDHLIPYSRWITPKMLPKRFDTTFFLALSCPTENPADGRADGKEIKSLTWLSPSEALSQFSEGKITLFPPQWYILSDLKKYSTFSELIKLSQTLPATPRPMAAQALNSSKNGRTMVLYGDEEYKPDDNEAKAPKGGRHRVTVIYEAGRPRKITREIKNAEINSKL